MGRYEFGMALQSFARLRKSSESGFPREEHITLSEEAPIGRALFIGKGLDDSTPDS